ncbi:MAG TPA: PQQ-binding-like beta-propeller repeat protein [Kineobactrum sp.]
MKKLTITLALAALAVFIGWQQFTAVPVARVIPDDGGTAWRPVGNPTVGAFNKHVATPITFRTMHVGLNNSDQLWIATAPEQELAWIAEQEMYIPEGPTMDNLGRIYFSPLYPREDVSLVVLDPGTGERLWSLPHKGDNKGAGAPLILDTPNEASSQTIYHATYHWAWAVTPGGEVLWHKPTGLGYAGTDVPHAWGVNYIPQLDALTVITGNGNMAVLARTTGAQLLAAPFAFPGAPAPLAARHMPSGWILRRGDKLAAERFGEMPLEDGLFTSMVRVIYGAGSEVANFYAVDPNSGRVFVAATAPDESDGSEDGVSANGAVYALDLLESGEHLTVAISARYDFDGGTGSTPTVSNDGQRLYITDENGNVMALDRDLEEIWRINVGEQVAASVAVSADNNELYVATRKDIIKLWNRGDYAEVAWTAQLDVFPDHINVNTLTPTITANGIAVAIGASRELGDNSLLMENGFGLLDRDTGKGRGYVQGVEEGIAVTVVAADGGFTIAHSPVRRLASKAIFGDAISPIIGGISRYKPVNLGRLAREASCAAAAIAARQGAQQGVSEYGEAEQQWDDSQIQALMVQASQALAGTAIAIADTVPPESWCMQLSRKGV